MGERVLIMAGGTGGHVFPALAVASELRARGVDVVWMGTQRGLEARIVPEAGIPIEWVSVSGLRGKGVASWLLAPWRLLVAVRQAIGIVRRCQPSSVLGMGGFVSGPGGLATWLLRKPLVIHEQNAIAGLTNRLLAPLAKRVFEAFPETFPASSKVVVSGNPVRESINRIADPQVRFGQRQGPLRLLVIGGSLGAQVLNQTVPETIDLLPEDERPEVWHQTGERNLEETRAWYRRHAVTARIEPFIDDMAEAYAWADLVLCRAGALTIAELAAAGVAAILVPYPYAVDDHQTRNAAYLADHGAAWLVSQESLNTGSLRNLLTRLKVTESGNVLSLDDKREQLLAMATAARRLAQPDATRLVADACQEVKRV
jgi:UDP-N-acetylglucosamine--N-acetylmuramyl-(pentapeptide) pyrophosphoryl-undecaprenol N-acetylglucosamine transferase